MVIFCTSIGYVFESICRLQVQSSDGILFETHYEGCFDIMIVKKPMYIWNTFKNHLEKTNSFGKDGLSDIFFLQKYT